MNIVCFRFEEEILDKLIKLNTEKGKIVLIRDAWDIENIEYSPELLDRITKIYQIKSIDSIEELSAIFVTLTIEFGEFDKAISAVEYAMFAAGFFMSLIKNDHKYLNTTIATRDKRYMKKKFGLAKLKYARNKANYSLEEMGNNSDHNLNYPVIAKPATGLGCYNTKQVNDDEELRRYFEELDLLVYFKSQQITLEEYIEGDEYHLDCVIKNGECKLFIISKYFVPRLKIADSIYNVRFKNGSYIIYEDNAPDLYKEVRKQFDRLLKEFDIEEGVTHTEFFVNGQGEYYYSEIAKRYAGAIIPNNIKQTFKIDLLDEWLKSELDYSDFTPISKNNKFMAWILLAPEKEGIIEEIPSREEYLSLPWIKDVEISVEKGGEFSFSNISLWQVAAIIQAEDENDFHEKVKKTHELLPIKTKTPDSD